MALTLADANQMIQAAIAKAEELQVKLSIAVCDTGGNLLAFSRMNGASAVSATVAQGKAAASAGFGRASGALQADSPVIQAIIATMGGRMLPARGAVPVHKTGELVRAIGASGATAGQDEQRLHDVLARRRAKSEEFFATAAAGWDRLRGDLFGDTFFLWAILGLIDPSLTVGDLGCGTGQLAETVAPHVHRVIAVDASDDMLTAARARLGKLSNVDLRKGDLEALPIPAGELDAAVMSLVLHYSPDPARALAEVARVLQPGGRVLIVDMLPHEHGEYQQQMGHVWLGFSDRQTTRFLTAAGFGNVRVRALPTDTRARGPALFAAVATKHS